MKKIEIKNLKFIQRIEIEGLHRINKTHTYEIIGDYDKSGNEPQVFVKAGYDLKKYIRNLKNVKMLVCLETDIKYILGFVKIDNQEVLVYRENGKKVHYDFPIENIKFLNKDIKKIA